MVLDPVEPKKVVTSLSILIEGDDKAVKTVDEIHQPDNIESTVNGSTSRRTRVRASSSTSRRSSSPIRSRTEARLWQYRFDTGVATVAAKVDQSADETTPDVDPSASQGNLGAWESSGVVDASAAFGPGAFLVNVQAHTLLGRFKAPGDDNFPPAGR